MASVTLDTTCSPSRLFVCSAGESIARSNADFTVSRTSFSTLPSHTFTAAVVRSNGVPPSLRSSPSTCEFVVTDSGAPPRFSVSITCNNVVRSSPMMSAACESFFSCSRTVSSASSARRVASSSRSSPAPRSYSLNFSSNARRARLSLSTRSNSSFTVSSSASSSSSSSRVVVVVPVPLARNSFPNRAHSSLNRAFSSLSRANIRTASSPSTVARASRARRASLAASLASRASRASFADRLSASSAARVLSSTSSTRTYARTAATPASAAPSLRSLRSRARVASRARRVVPRARVALPRPSCATNGYRVAVDGIARRARSIDASSANTLGGGIARATRDAVDVVARRARAPMAWRAWFVCDFSLVWST